MELELVIVSSHREALCIRANKQPPTRFEDAQHLAKRGHVPTAKWDVLQHVEGDDDIRCGGGIRELERGIPIVISNPSRRAAVTASANVAAECPPRSKPMIEPGKRLAGTAADVEYGASSKVVERR